jgi:hypothetical protein
MTKSNLKYIYRFNSYRAVNTLSVDYKISKLIL